MAELEFAERAVMQTDVQQSVIESKLRAGIPLRGLYFLCAEIEGRHMLEILNGGELAKTWYQAKRYRVVGVTESKAAAFELLRQIAVEFTENRQPALTAGHELDGFGEYLRTGLRS